MLLLEVDKKHNQPIYLQVVNQIEKLIQTGTLKEGDKLPASRVLAKKLEVNRTTIYRAYEELWARGYIESKQGSYSYIRVPVQRAKNIVKNAESIIDWNQKVNTDTNDILNDFEKNVTRKTLPNHIDFRPLAPDPIFSPIHEFRKCLNEILVEEGAKLMQYGDPLGYYPLREFIAKQMQLHGINTSADQIIITHGMQNGLSLLLQLFQNSEEFILTEDPTYSAAIPLFKLHNAKLLGIPIQSNGLDLKFLQNVLKHKAVNFLYTMPNFQNPSGITTSQSHREELLNICEKNEVPILEDGFEEEMKYLGKAVLPIKSMDRNGIVIYMGTFSKILFPGLRIGWIVADKSIVQKFKILKYISSLTDSMILQAALNKFCRKGFYELHIKRVHRIYKKRMQIALRTLRENIDSNKFIYSKPQGGYTIWVEAVDSKIDEDDLISALEKNDLLVSPGKLFYTKEYQNASFRISVAHRNEEEIATGCKKITEIINNYKT